MPRVQRNGLLRKSPASASSIPLMSAKAATIRRGARIPACRVATPGDISFPTLQSALAVSFAPGKIANALSREAATGALARGGGRWGGTPGRLPKRGGALKGRRNTPPPFSWRCYECHTFIETGSSENPCERIKHPVNVRKTSNRLTWRTHSCVPCRHSWRHLFPNQANWPFRSRPARPRTP